MSSAWQPAPPSSCTAAQGMLISQSNLTWLEALVGLCHLTCHAWCVEINLLNDPLTTELNHHFILMIVDNTRKYCYFYLPWVLNTIITYFNKSVTLNICVICRNFVQNVFQVWSMSSEKQRGKWASVFEQFQECSPLSWRSWTGHTEPVNLCVTVEWKLSRLQLRVHVSTGVVEQGWCVSVTVPVTETGGSVLPVPPWEEQWPVLSETISEWLWSPCWRGQESLSWVNMFVTLLWVAWLRLRYLQWDSRERT